MSTEPCAPLGAPLLFYAATPTGAVVRSPHLIAWAHAANVCALRRPAKRFQIDRLRPSADPYVVGYTRTSTSINYARLRWFYLADTAYEELQVDLTIRDSAGNSVASSATTIPAGFKNETRTCLGFTGIPSEDYREGGTGYLDLDALAATLVGADWSFEFTVTRPTGTVVIVDRIEIQELPRDIVDSAEDYGLVTLDADPGDPIFAGSVSQTGFRRLHRTLDGARLVQRAYGALGSWSATSGTATPTTASATWAPLIAAAPVAGFTYQSIDDGAGTPAAAIYQTRVRNIGATAVAGEACRARFYYRVVGGGTAEFRVTTGATGSPFTLTGQAGGWKWSDWLAVALATNGASQLDTWKIEAQFAGGATNVYVSAVQIDENVA